MCRRVDFQTVTIETFTSMQKEDIFFSGMAFKTQWCLCFLLTEFSSHREVSKVWLSLLFSELLGISAFHHSLLLLICSSSVQFTSVHSLSRVGLFVTLWTAACQASLSITNSGVHTNPCPSSWWYHPTISSSVVPFSSCPQSFPAQGLFKWVSSSHQVAKAFQL